MTVLLAMVSSVYVIHRPECSTKRQMGNGWRCVFQCFEKIAFASCFMKKFTIFYLTES